MTSSSRIAPRIADVLINKGADVVTALPSATVRQAARKMDEANVGSLLVEEKSRIIGIVTERDFLRRVLAANRDPDQTLVSEVMSSPVRSVPPHATLQEAARVMATEHIRHVAVIEDTEPVGLISLRDVIHAAERGF